VELYQNEAVGFASSGLDILVIEKAQENNDEVKLAKRRF